MSHPHGGSRALALRLLPTMVGLALLLGFSLLFAFDQQTYFAGLRAWILRPFPHPFIDWEWMPSAVVCWNRGVDVYVDNICYLPLAHGRHSYSPLLLRAWFLAPLEGWLYLCGLFIGVLFLLSLTVLPPPSSRRELLLRMLATCSSATFFAIERANIDLLLFVITICGAWLWTGGPVRRCGAYSVFLFAGALKFYPLVLLLLALRESRRGFFGVCAATLTVMGVMVLSWHDELISVMDAIPTVATFGFAIGADVLPDGIAEIARLAVHGDPAFFTTIERLRIASRVALTLGCCGLAWWLLAVGHLGVAVRGLAPPTQAPLLTGSAVLVGCFFAGSSIGYRAIYLLLVLPGLITLSSKMASRGARFIVTLAGLSSVLVMWVPSVLNAIRELGFSSSDLGTGSNVGLLHWMLVALSWWVMIAVFLGALGDFVWSNMRRLWGERRQRRSSPVLAA